MDAFSVFKSRRSIRKYSERKIADNDLEKIIEIARLAPTARNIQPWEFIVVRDKISLKRLSELVSPNGSMLSGASACLIVVCRDTKYFLEDGCAATVSAIYAACALGIGSCWIAGDKKDYCDQVKNFLKIPTEYKLISLISLGYPKETPDPQKRKINELLHWEKF